jgi:hypothetical protein
VCLGTSSCGKVSHFIFVVVVFLLPANEKVEDINVSPRSQSHMVSLLVLLSFCGADSIISAFIFTVTVLKAWSG